MSAWLQTFGEKQGWQYMDDLHQNIGQYVHSGSKPCKLAASGEFPIGISFEYPAVQLSPPFPVPECPCESRSRGR